MFPYVILPFVPLPGLRIYQFYNLPKLQIVQVLFLC